MANYITEDARAMKICIWVTNEELDVTLFLNDDEINYYHHKGNKANFAGIEFNNEFGIYQMHEIFQRATIDAVNRFVSNVANTKTNSGIFNHAIRIYAKKLEEPKKLEDHLHANYCMYENCDGICLTGTDGIVI